MACGKGEGPGRTGPQNFLTSEKVLSKPLRALVGLPRAGSYILGSRVHTAPPHWLPELGPRMQRKRLVPRGVARAEGISLPPCPHGPVFPGIPWMLRWGFLEILFLRSWLNSWICLLPTLASPPREEEGGGGASVGGKRSRELSSDLCIAFLSTLSIFPNIPGRLDVGTSALPHS